MIRFASLIALPFLLDGAPAAAQPYPEDPRVCMIDQATPEQRTFIATAIRDSHAGLESLRSGTSASAGSMLHFHQSRCMASRNWRQNLLSPAYEVARAEYEARYFEGELVKLGFDISGLHQFVASLPQAEIRRLTSDALHKIKPMKNYQPSPLVDRVEAGVLRPALARMGQSLPPAQEEFFWQALLHRSLAKTFLQKFNTLSTLDRSPMLIDPSQLVPALRANMPVISQRALNSEEKAAARRIAAEYAGKPAARTADSLQTLIGIARSGDRDTMIALRDALTAGPPTDLVAQYHSLDLDTDLLYQLPKLMAAQWTAQIWSLHGIESAGRPIIAACVDGLITPGKRGYTSAIRGGDGVVAPVNANGERLGSSSAFCGFDLLAKPAYDRRNGKLQKIAAAGEQIERYDGYAFVPTETGDFVITGIRFASAGNADAEDRFQQYLVSRSRGDFLNDRGQPKMVSRNSVFVDAYFRQYARDTGRSSHIEIAEAGRQAELQRLSAEREQRKQALWDAAVRSYRSSMWSIDAQAKLETTAIELGLEYYGKFREIVPSVQARSGGASQAVTGLSTQQVEVRSYDSSGTYRGSARTSAFWADVLKMTSSPPR